MPEPSEPTGDLAFKRAALAAVARAVEARLRTAQAAAADAYDAATQDEARAEDKYDTRALEQGYLSAGQNARIVELRNTLIAMNFYEFPVGPQDRVAPGALVTADLGDRTVRYLVLPFAVGERARVGDVDVEVVGSATPVAQALLGKRLGDLAVLRVAGTVRELEVLGIS